MKKIVVTGGLGFIGSNLINYLHKKNYFVINLDKKQFYSSNYNIKNKSKKNYKFIKVDINQKEQILKILKKFKPAGIFNLAAETHVDRSIDNPDNFIKSNILGVYNLLEALKSYERFEKKIKLIHISTDEVYGDIPIGKKSKENDVYQPSSPYSSSKASADLIIKSYCRTYGMNIIVTNCCNNYGPGQYPEKLIPKLVMQIKRGQPLDIYGKGKNSREWIYVEDHCEALYKIFNKGKIGENYNIGSGLNITNLKLAKKIISIFNKCQLNKKNIKIRFVKDRPGHDLRYALNINKIKKEIKWRSKTNFDNGLSITIKWYLNNPKFMKSFLKKISYKRIGLIND
mgnify:CR=1 FL=1